jgi:oxygen-independent coproporphyrinogen-3 oxidase
MPITADTVGLYLSIPFCRSKCSFCNFASNTYSSTHHAAYIDRLCEQLAAARHQAEAIGAILPQQVDTIYLGGGTPSVLDPTLLHQMFAAIHQHFAVSPDAEITMECAPGLIDDAVLAAMTACGINRVSLGVQSFNDREAASTGRLHNRATTLSDIDRLRAAGILRINLDLIAGLPHQTLDSWRESLAILTDTGVQHASIYLLEIDDESRLGKELLNGGARYHAGAVPKDDTIATMFDIANQHLSAAGLNQYEISNYAVPAQESKHNLKYWLRHPYLGIGLDAHSMLHPSSAFRTPGNPGYAKNPVLEGHGFSRANTLRSEKGLQPLGYALPETAQAVRFSYTDDLPTFLANPTWQDLNPLTPQAELEEAWFLGLRLTTGLDLHQLEQTHGDISPYLPLLNRLQQDGLLQQTGTRVALTSRGQLLSNDVFSQFLDVEHEIEEELCPAS